MMIDTAFTIGIALTLLIVFFWLRAKARKREPSEEISNRYCRSNFTKRTIDLSACEIKNNDYNLEVEFNDKSAAINNLMVYEDKNVEIRVVKQTVIVYTEIDLETRVSRSYQTKIIEKDKRTVEMYCAIKKTVDLYINPDNPDDYYFDISKLFD